jgi:hypothetical protein
MRLSTALDWLSLQGVKVFIRIDDELTFGLSESLASSRDHNVTFASNSIDVLNTSFYNYPQALVVTGSYEPNLNISHYIFDQSNIGKCVVDCIAINITDLSVLDGVIDGVIYADF